MSHVASIPSFTTTSFILTELYMGTLLNAKEKQTPARFGLWMRRQHALTFDITHQRPASLIASHSRQQSSKTSLWWSSTKDQDISNICSALEVALATHGGFLAMEPTPCCIFGRTTVVAGVTQQYNLTPNIGDPAL